MILGVVAKHFPYGRGEFFFEEELPYLAARFDSVIIFCLEAKKDKPAFDLPENCKAVCVRKSRYDGAFSGLLSLFSPRFLKELAFAKKNFNFSAKDVAREVFLANATGKPLVREIKRHIGDPENTVLYSYWCDGPAYALAKIKREFPQIYCVSRAHGGDCFIDRGYIPFRREVLSGLDRVYSISEAGKKSIEKNLSPHALRPCEIEVSRLGVMPPERQNPTEGDGVFRVVTCSNAIALKRLDLIAAALSGTRCEWHHFGDGPLLDKIKAKAAELKINARFWGFTPKEKIFEFYKSTHIDAFINASDYEGIPVSIMEAMAHGIPCVARDVGGNGEIVKDGAGILLPQNCTAQDIRRAISKITPAMRERAHAVFEAEYNADANFSRFAQELFERGKNAD